MDNKEAKYNNKEYNRVFVQERTSAMIILIGSLHLQKLFNLKMLTDLHYGIYLSEE